MSPHFRISHKPQCFIAGQEQLVRKGVVMKSRTQVPGAATFPGKLIRPDMREVVGDEEAVDPERNHTRGPHGAGRNRGAGPLASEVSTLLPICRHFVSYESVGFADRGLDLPGRFPGEPAQIRRYDDAFRRLRGNAYCESIPNRIVFAPLLFAAKLEFTDQYIAVPVFAGPIDAKRKFPTAPHRLRIDWSSWPERRRDSTLYRIKQHRADGRRFYGDKGRAESMLVFAYAQRDLIGTTDFVVDSPFDYCILAVQRGGRNRESRTGGVRRS